MSIDEIDLNTLIGKRIRLRRKELRRTLADVAGDIGITGQALFKYEIGETRIPAARLYLVASTLGVPASYFFDVERTSHPVTASGPSEMEEAVGA